MWRPTSSAPWNLERVANWRSWPGGEKLIDDDEAQRIKREHCCRNCGALAVGPSKHCRACAGETKRGKPRSPEVRKAISEAKQGVAAPGVATALRLRWECDWEFRARVLHQLTGAKSAEDENIAAQLRRVGMAGTATAAELLVFSPHTLWSAGARECQGVPVRQGLRRMVQVAHVDVTTTTGKILRRLAFNPKELGDSYYQRTGSQDGYRRLSQVLSAANGTDFGRPRVLAEPEVEEALALRAADPRTWGWRSLAEKINNARTTENDLRDAIGLAPLPLVSHMTVKRAVERRQGRL
jgi:hypothetical protein